MQTNAVAARFLRLVQRLVRQVHYIFKCLIHRCGDHTGHAQAQGDDLGGVGALVGHLKTKDALAN